MRLNASSAIGFPGHALNLKSRRPAEARSHLQVLSFSPELPSKLPRSFLTVSGIPGYCMLGGAAGCVQRLEVLSLAMSGTSEHYTMGSVVGCVQRLGVLFLTMSGISEHYTLGSVVGHVQRLGVLFLAMSGNSEHYTGLVVL